MNHLTTGLAIACAVALFATIANAETVDELKRELARPKGLHREARAASA